MQANAKRMNHFEVRKLDGELVCRFQNLSDWGIPKVGGRLREESMYDYPVEIIRVK